MGNSLNKKNIVVRVPTFHSLNQPIDVDSHYEILEYWFSSIYTQEDKENHIIDINPLPEPETPSDQESERKSEIKIKKKKLKPLGYWDRHSSIHFDAIQKWHMTDPE